MTINDIEIPDSEIEKLAGTKQRILQALHIAFPSAISVRDLYNAAGTGAPSRMRELNRDFLAERGLVITARIVRVNERGTQIWEYFLARARPQADRDGQFILSCCKEVYRAERT
jgi:hypothetical protein